MAANARNGKQQRKRANWSPEAREAARQRAYKMIEEGKFGGAPGRGGRPKNRSPRANELLLILRKLSDRAVLFEQDGEVLRSAELIAPLLQVATDHGGLDLDREHGVHLVVLGVRQLLNDGTITPLVRLDGDDVVERVSPRSGEHKKRVIEDMKKRGGRVVDLSQFAVLDARAYGDAELVECACLLGALSTRPLLRTAVADMVRALYTRVAPLITVALERRGIAAPTSATP